MWLRIFDVEHGFFACVSADNRNLIVFDCGHNSTTDFRPSAYLHRIQCSGIEYFVITNYDDDHVSDLHNIFGVFPIEVVARNPSVPLETLRGIKLESGPLSPGLEAMFDLLETATESDPQVADFAGIKISDLHIVIPGDLERPGWEKLLENSEFRNELAGVNIFVASHHGRRGGFCDAVFDICTPDVVIVSDKAIVHDTQMVDYGQVAKGIKWYDRTKRVFSTRKNGYITLKQVGRSGPTIDAQYR
jgi:beta-lactamase superfamily II metal-dependent hydrolase